MRPNLSVESIAGALAVLGTGVIMAACGGGDAPKSPDGVNASEVPGTAAKSAGDTAAHCGAGKEHKAGEASCSADKTDPAVVDPAAAAKPAVPSALTTTPAAATPADAKATTDTKTVAPVTTGTSKKPAAPAAAKKGASGSCGAGTCSAKK